MKLRFSRSSLNLIIFSCIILIGWASIDKNSKLEALNEDTSSVNHLIELTQLEPLNEQSWTSQEGIQVIWQSRLDTDFLIRVRGNRPMITETVNNPNISWLADYWQWDLSIGTDFESGLNKFSQQLQDFPNELKGQAGSIILQGPWSPEIARLSSARIIKDLQLRGQPLVRGESAPNIKSNPSSRHFHCPWQPVSAQFWLQDQLTTNNLRRPNIIDQSWQIQQLPKFNTISAASLNSWKQVFIQQWSVSWQNPQKQFDMLSDLAYYRLPANYLLQGYWQINELTPSVLEDYLAQCRKDVR